mmetsp:Transcript_43989/g.112040  ORF Transcript_43989/g.112040 Transcript_43989/m.112040 type:complete len:260 (-) Transcript_43989:68-847(-)
MLDRSALGDEILLKQPGAWGVALVLGQILVREDRLPPIREVFCFSPRRDPPGLATGHLCYPSLLVAMVAVARSNAVHCENVQHRLVETPRRLPRRVQVIKYLPLPPPILLLRSAVCLAGHHKEEHVGARGRNNREEVLDLHEHGLLHKITKVINHVHPGFLLKCLQRQLDVTKFRHELGLVRPIVPQAPCFHQVREDGGLLRRPHAAKLGRVPAEVAARREGAAGDVLAHGLGHVRRSLDVPRGPLADEHAGLHGWRLQ